jgi:DnaJ-class molecular chaperone
MTQPTGDNLSEEPIEDCPDCGGAGGYDASRDCETYDDWHDCETCEGSGRVLVGYERPDEFVPARDAFTPND